MHCPRHDGLALGYNRMDGYVTPTMLRQMKRDGRKIVAAVLYDYQMAQIADRAGVDIVSAGDSVGVALWGHASESELTIDQMILVCQAVRRGARRVLVSCDVPLSALQQTPDAALDAARRLVREGGADLLKVDVAASSVDLVRALAEARIAVWAQMDTAGDLDAPAVDRLVRDAKTLEAAGAVMLDFRHSGPVAGPAVVAAVRIPVIGGLGGGPWLDGRVRSAAAALGYFAASADDGTDRYASIAATALTAIGALCDDVRAARPLRGEPAPGS
jgi:3-methyl-2-oxobutanoate hydroxymethyltransferase